MSIFFTPDPQDRDARYALILDEIDRGDAARSLGEFLGAAAERGQSVRVGTGV